MLRLASDADVHGDILRGLRRRMPNVDLVRTQDIFPMGTPDPEVLAWAAAEDRVLITNDRNTMVGYAYDRISADEKMPGLIVTTNEQSLGSSIDDILKNGFEARRMGTRTNGGISSVEKLDANRIADDYYNLLAEQTENSNKATRPGCGLSRSGLL